MEDRADKRRINENISSLILLLKKTEGKRRGSMTINISKHYNQHIKKLDQNNFIYKVKKAFYLLTSQEERLYEVGFSEGFLYAVNILQKEPIKDSNVRKIVGYTVTKPKPLQIESVINNSLIFTHFYPFWQPLFCVFL